jgi:hypothetical protein
MVRSNIFDECVYLETKHINKRDEKSEMMLYEIELLNCNSVFITVGQPNKKNRLMCLPKADRENISSYSTKDENQENTIIYHLVYLMDGQDNETAICRIGVYEILETKYQTFLDEDGDLNIENLKPLFFSFVNEQFLIENNYNCKLPVEYVEYDSQNSSSPIEVIKERIVEDSIEQSNEEATREESAANSESSDPTKYKESLLSIYPKQTLEQYNEEYSKTFLRKPMEGDEQAIQWVRAYLLNEYFKIKDKGGAGDCLFYALASAINNYSIENKSNGVPVFSNQDVSSLREIISENVTEEDYDNYMTIYNDLTRQKKNTTREIKKYMEEHKRISNNFKQTTNEARRKELVIENTEIKKSVKELEKQLINIKQMLNEFKYMKSIKTLRDFKSFLLTSQYWGDEMAIGILQKHFNFKAIIMSQENFVNQIQNKPLPLSEETIKNMKNIIQCGSSSLGGIENPYFYIILNYTGNHYQIVSYRDKEAFSFDEIPFTLKLAIVRGCMKQDLQAGYGKIEKFVEFRDEHIELMF